MAEGNIKPRVGLIAESDLNRHLLAKLLTGAGYELALNMDTATLAEKFAGGELRGIDEQLDAWLLDIEEKDIHKALDILIEHSDMPLLVNDEIPSSRQAEEFQYWQRRLTEKLEVIAVPKVAESAVAAPARRLNQVWVLAASFGGPEAVKRFLSLVPAQLPVAMVYGQHIETNFDQVLTRAVGIDHSYPIRLLRGRSHLGEGEVAVVPADRQVRFLPRGEVVETRQRWSGPYQPSLDQVIAELARLYRERLGVIVFSGMCNDGEIGCRVAAACGSTVWVQSPESCMSADMPTAVLNTGCVSFQGTPEELARNLGKHYKTRRRPIRQAAQHLAGAVK